MTEQMLSIYLKMYIQFCPEVGKVFKILIKRLFSLREHPVLQAYLPVSDCLLAHTGCIILTHCSQAMSNGLAWDLPLFAY